MPRQTRTSIFVDDGGIDHQTFVDFRAGDLFEDPGGVGDVRRDFGEGRVSVGDESHLHARGVGEDVGGSQNQKTSRLRGRHSVEIQRVSSEVKLGKWRDSS